jgi:heme/copper-type cytochrome/quinol oxidase subunit 3
MADETEPRANTPGDQRMSELALEEREVRVVHSLGWWGMWLFILTEAALFVFLLFSYYYVTIQPHSSAWPPDGPLSLKLSLPNTVILILSSVAAWFGAEGARRGFRPLQLAGLAIAFLLGLAFAIIQTFEWGNQTFTITSGSYGSLFFTITGFHLAHVTVGLLILLALLVWSAMGYLGRMNSRPVAIGVIYWHFVDAVWLFVFFTFYLTPYLGLLHE